MIFIDLTCQGIGPFKEPFKVSTEGKSVAIKGFNSSGKTFIKKAILSCLFNNFFNLLKEEQKPFFSEKPSRCALTFKGKNGIFRIVRDLKQSKSGLFKYEPKNKKFDLYTSDDEQIHLTLIEEASLPDEEGFTNFFIYQDDKLLSSGKVSAPALKSPIDSSLAPEAEQQDKETIKKELAKAEKIKELEFKLDELERKSFELEENKSKAMGIIERKNEIEKKIEEYKTVEHLPLDIEEKINRYSDESERVRIRLSAMEDRIREEESNRLVIESMHLLRNKLFWICLVLFIGGALGFFLFPDNEKFGWIKNIFPVLSILGLGGGIFSGWKHLSMNEQLKEIDERIEKLQTEKRKIQKDFDMEYAIIPELMKEFSLTFPEEINEIIEKRKELQKELEEIEAKLEAMLGEINPEEIDKKQEEIKEEIENIKQQLNEIGPLMATEEELREQLEGVSFDSDLEAGLDYSFQETGESTSEKDLETVFQQLFHRDFSSFLFESEESLSQMVTSLSGGKWKGLTYGNGLVLRSDTKELPYYLLSSSEKAIAQLSLIFTLRVWCRETFPLPLILDCPETFLDRKTKSIFSKLLKDLSRKIQIILLYRDEEFDPHFEKSISLK